MTKTFYVLEAQTSGIDAEFYINDIPIVLRGPDHGQNYAAPVNQYLLDGPNELAMVVKPGPTPSQSQTGRNGQKETFSPTSEKAWAKISSYPQKATIGGPDGTELMKVEWPIRDERKSRDDYQPMEYPLKIVQFRDMGQMFGSCVFQQAPKIKIDDTVKNEIYEMLEALRGSLAGGDAELYIQLQKIRLEEVARAFQTSSDERRQMVREVTRMDSQQSWWGFPSLDKEQFDLRLAARGTMVQCIDKRWDAILRENANDKNERAYYSLFVSKLEGKWVILR
ncbi:hypothetical protein RAS1_26600 [Phycisphaerae bacterium RAS1]|nr:hypothetical protein RAS1_26600 [Phycisphaerae bacterium RAS1]